MYKLFLSLTCAALVVLSISHLPGQTHAATIGFPGAGLSGLTLDESGSVAVVYVYAAAHDLQNPQTNLKSNVSRVDANVSDSVSGGHPDAGPDSSSASARAETRLIDGQFQPYGSNVETFSTKGDYAVSGGYARAGFDAGLTKGSAAVQGGGIQTVISLGDLTLYGAQDPRGSRYTLSLTDLPGTRLPNALLSEASSQLLPDPAFAPGISIPSDRTFRSTLESRLPIAISGGYFGSVTGFSDPTRTFATLDFSMTPDGAVQFTPIALGGVTFEYVRGFEDRSNIAFGADDFVRASCGYFGVAGCNAQQLRPGSEIEITIGSSVLRGLFSDEDPENKMVRLPLTFDAVFLDGSNAQVGVVPEPSTLLLLGSGFIVLGSMMRMKRRFCR